MEGLEATGIGKVVNGLRRRRGEIGILAKTLVLRWKFVVKLEVTREYFETLGGHIS